MLQTSTHSSKSHRYPMGFVPAANLASSADRVEARNLSRDASLRNASIAGIVLSFNPRDDEMREKAERAWESIRTLLARRLLDEKTELLPWAGDSSIGSATAADILKKR